MVQLLFDGLPTEVLSGWPFILHVITCKDGADTPDNSYDDYLTLELIGPGVLHGEMKELASGGQADFLSLSYEGRGPFRLRALAPSGDEVISEEIAVEATADEKRALAALGSAEALDEVLETLDQILSAEGATTAEAAVITESFLLGGKHAAEAASRENPQKITHVLNCCEPWYTEGPNSRNLSYCGFEAYDEPGYRLLEEHYEATIRPFLLSVDGRCLVHCAMGVNRSALVLAAFLIDQCGFTLSDAVQLLKTQRGQVLGNRSFRLQLIEFAAQRPGKVGKSSI